MAGVFSNRTCTSEPPVKSMSYFRPRVASEPRPITMITSETR